MAETERQADLISTIQAALESHGWKPQSGTHWVNHVFDSGHGKLAVRYYPEASELVFAFESDTHEAKLAITFKQDPADILTVISRHQEGLSPETWEPFMRDLMESSPRVFSLEGEDGDDKVRLKSLEQGVRALREKNWEYVNSTEHELSEEDFEL